jgi:hypothetical protein
MPLLSLIASLGRPGVNENPLSWSETRKIRRSIADQLNHMDRLSGEWAYDSRSVKLTSIRKNGPQGFGAVRFDATFEATPRARLGGCLGTCKISRIVLDKPVLRASEVRQTDVLPHDA